jgi:hypothetical protein
VKKSYTGYVFIFYTQSLAMTNKKLLAGLSAGILTATMMLSSFANAADTTVNMQITAGTITYGAPAAMTFATTLTTSFAAQTLSQDFTGASNYFWIQDLKGANSGYNTTLQMSGNLVAGTNVISGSNVSFKSIGAITTVSGTVNAGVQYDAASLGYQALSTTRTFIYRPNAANAGKIGYYGGNVNLKVDVPAAQAAGSYAGTLVYTLIEN